MQIIPAFPGASALLLQIIIASKCKMAIMWQDAGRNMTTLKTVNSLEVCISSTISEPHGTCKFCILNARQL